MGSQTSARIAKSTSQPGFMSSFPFITNFRGWCRVWGEPGENRGRTGGAQKNRGRTGGIWEENRGRTGGFGCSFTKSTGGEAGALGREALGQEPGGGNFLETRDPTRDLKINEQDRP